MYQLTLKLSFTTAADNNFDYFFYLPEKTSPDISSKFCLHNSHEMSRLIFSENRKRINWLLSITNFARHFMG